jgi:type I restriction enzyme S subunit
VIGWRYVPLGDLCDHIRGSSQPNEEEDYELWSVPSYAADRPELVVGRDIGSAKVPVRPGDVLICKINPRINRVWLVRDLQARRPQIASTEWMVARPRSTDEVLPEWLVYYFSSAGFREWIQSETKGTTGSHTRAKPGAVFRQLVPLPAIGEQERIVRVLDDAFTLIDGVIQKTQQRQAIAEDLFRSELTETTNQLSRWPRKLLPEIATEFGRGRSRHRPRNAKHLYGGPYPFIQTGDIRNSDHWINDYAQSYSEAGLEQSKLWPEGTVCITIAANIAESGILGFEACFPDSVIGAVLNPDLMAPEFLEYLLQADKARLQAKGKGTAQDNINVGTFQAHPYPVPPLTEQERVVAHLNALRAETSRLSKISSAKLKKLSDLKWSLLQQAFSGGLSLDPMTLAGSLGGWES